MPTSAWTGSISFGLVNVPVQLYKATETHSGPDFHQVHVPDGGRIRLKRFCELEDVEVPLHEISRGLTVGRREVVLTSADMDTLPLPSRFVIDVQAFVDAGTFDAVQFDQAYYVGLPRRTPGKPYALLREAMRERGQVAVAKVTLTTRESLAVLRVVGDMLVLHTMLWPDEVRSPQGVPTADDEIHSNELKMTISLMHAMSRDFRFEDLHDEYRHALEELVDAKLHGEQPAEIRRPRRAVVDITKVLAESLAAAEAAHPAHEPEPAPRKQAAKKPAPAAKKAPAKKTTPRRTG
jgi:DNA end-binding protein Ku